jgi:hypothetical protein
MMLDVRKKEAAICIACYLYETKREAKSEKAG